MKIKSFENDTAQRILSAATKLISRDGYASVSMRDIAAEAGVALSHLNYYYKNKEGLFLAVIRNVKTHYLEDLRCRMNTIAAGDKKSSYLLSHFKQSIKNNSYIYRLVLDFSNLALWSPPFQDELATLIDDAAEIIQLYSSDEETAGAAAAGFTARDRARFMIALNLGVAAQYLAGSTTGSATAGEDILKIFDFAEMTMK